MAKALSRHQRDHLQEWIDDTKSGLGLTDWVVALQRKPCADSAHAHILTNWESRYAVLSVDPNFLSLSEERQAEVLVHELIHIWTAPLIRQIKLLESAIGLQAWQIWEENWGNSIELIVDGLARAIAHNFNPINWAGCNGGDCYAQSPASLAGLATGDDNEAR